MFWSDDDMSSGSLNVYPQSGDVWSTSKVQSSSRGIPDSKETDLRANVYWNTEKRRPSRNLSFCKERLASFKMLDSLNLKILPKSRTGKSPKTVEETETSYEKWRDLFLKEKPSSAVSSASHWYLISTFKWSIPSFCLRHECLLELKKLLLSKGYIHLGNPLQNVSGIFSHPFRDPRDHSRILGKATTL